MSDAFNDNTDTSYAGGIKQADECPATGTGSVDNKTDIARIYVAASTDPVTKHVYLDLAWVRAPQNTTTSDVHIGFEFNQNKTPCGAGSAFVHRTAGDILLVYNFQSGSATIAYSQWTGSAWTPEVTLSSSIAEAAVFGGTTTTDSIKPSNGINPATDEFGEAGIDLTAATSGLGNNGRACEQFGTAFGESRTSGSSTTAQMKDYAGPAAINISNCVTPSLTTTQQPASGAMGDTFKDKATLSGANTPDGTGTITFKLYSAADCGGSVLDTEVVSNINANGDYTTPTGFVLQNAGTYYWVASFSGDGFNNEKTTGCNDEPVTVGKASPSVSTTQQPASGAIGDTYKDKATLSNAVNLKGTGSITFKLYSAADCGGSVLDTETVTAISANGDYTTPVGFAIQNAGTYYWVASFSGDANNDSFTSGCNDEPVVVAKNQPSISTTQQPASGAIGDTYKDKATLSGGVNYAGTGAINFKLYSAADCGGSVLDNETVSAISANGDYTTPVGFAIQNAGTYYWVASFNGDANNKSFTSGCNDEPVVVAKNQPSISTTQQPASGAIGDTYKDKATLSGGVNYDGSGAITFTLYSAADCGGSVLDTESVSSISANGDYTTPVGFAIQNAGTYYWVASFNGDANNKPFTSGCNDEPVVVGKNQPSIVTTQQPASGSVADTYKDKATLSGGVNYDGSGAITFTLYSAADCGGQVLDTETITGISANGNYTTPVGVQLNSAGTYYWVASFSGDANNKSFTSGCNDEPVVVNPASIHIAKTADAAQVNAGEQIGFTLTVYNTGAGNAYGVSLSDVLPVKAGLSWSIAGQGAGWAGTCAITAGTLNCGPKTVPAGTTLAASTFTVHITSPTTGATGGVCPDGSGVVNNTGDVTTTNDGSDEASASTCVAAPSIHIVKTADAAQVNAGDPIGFTLTVYNNGSGDAKGVSLSDVLPINAGLSWSIAGQGAGWASSCAITAGTLNCGPKTVPAGTTLAGSTFTVHITSPTTAATGGTCPDTGVVDNTGHVTTTNDGSDQSNAQVCVAAPSIHIVKTADAAQVNAGEQIGFTLTVYNTGTGDAYGVSLSDVLPVKAGLSWSIAGQGSGWGGSCAITAGTLNCGPVTVPHGTTEAGSTFTVHIVSGTTAATGGVCPGGSGKVDNTGNVTTTNDGSDQSSASTCVAAPSIHIVKTADAAQVNAGDPIGFTLTVYNNGSGDAKGVTLSDVLPVKAGLSWSVAGQGSGWAGSCAITAGTLNCGPVTVPAGTTQAGSTFTVHITSPTTAATGGVCPDGSGVVNNTGNVTTTNDGSDQDSAATCVAAPSIHIVKTADAAQVNAGDPIGFTLTVYNNGSGDAKGVSLSDVLPVKAGLSWSIAGQGAGWAGTCAITAGTLNCGPVTVPHGTTQAGSTFTVHITSPTTAATGGVCPEGSGVVNNTGNVTTTNDGSDQSSASTCVAAPSIHIVKTADAAQVNAGDPIGFTLTVYNNGTGDAKGVSLSDVLPTTAGLSWSIASQGAGWASSCAITAGTLNCGPNTVPAGTTLAGSTFTVHITSPTTAATGGVCPGGSGVINNTGNVTTTNDGSDQDSAATCVAAPSIHIVKTADAAQVSAGDPIGFTLTVYNNGSGDAKGVSLSDPLPTNAGLSWSIAGQGAGWAGTCAITAGTLNCGPVTVPAGTTLAGSTFTVHITSPTTAATGGSCPNSGVVDNTGNVTTTNDGSDQSSASVCVAAPSIQIVKTADAAQVNAGEPIGFTLTVFNTGTGDAKGVTLSDVLPVKAGLSWSIANQGAGWGGSCAITAGTLNCGPVTVPFGTTQVGSTFTVHITSPTTAATGGVCPGGSGKVDNTGNVATTNDGSGQSSASTCVAAPSIHIVKTADAAQVNAGDPIGFTLTVYNNGSGDAKGVSLSDPLPVNAGLSWSIASQGAGWASSCAITAGTLNCGPVTVPAGTTLAASTFTVHITSPTTAATGGNCPETGVVHNTGNVTTTNDGSDQSSASTCVAAPSIHIVKTADAAQVNAGDPIGFTLTVYNNGTGDAKGVTLSDVLPVKAGLSWSIDGQGAGWGGSCAITAGTLNCGPVTVPHGTTLAGSTFTVHVTSPTTAATGGVCPEGSGVVNNTGNVTTTNDGSDQSSASTCVAAPSIHIVKTADAAQVNAGDPIGFTLTVYNNGTGDAKGVSLSDSLPTNAGLSWSIASQGAGWASSCSITAGTLNCGPVTVPAGTTLAGSTFTVHITSPTTAATGGACPETGVVNNTGNVTTTNDGSDQDSASTCVAAPSIHVVKTADAAQVNAGDPIGFTLTVYNNGTGDAKGVTLSDPLPVNAGLSWSIANQGAGWAGTCAITAGTLNCGPVTVPAGTTQAGSTFTVHITSPTTAATSGNCPNTGVVNNTGSVTTTNDGSDEASASTCVAAPAIQILKTADAAQVDAGDQIGFTLTVYNTGTGDAKGVTLSDPLPVKAGLSWQIASQGAGWGASCSITAGTLNCGPVTVPAGTTLGGSTFTVHITSPTTAETAGVCPEGSGVVDNTGSVATTNDGSGESSASTCVASASVQIVKTADAAQVNAGDPIGFTLTVYNTGTGAGKGVTLSDPLPTNPGLSWQIDSQGAGWADTCAITAGTLNCGPVTVPAGTTQAASTFTVHITSPTTPLTGGVCPETGVVNNTGTVTSTNDGGGQSSDSVCVVGLTDLSITKVGTPPTQDVVAGTPFQNVTWTMVVKNNGPAVDTNVTVGDPIPAGTVYVSSTTTKGSCTGGAILSCSLGTLQVGETVTITLVTTPTTEGQEVNTATVVGDLAETDLTNNTATASVIVATHRVIYCTAAIVRPRQLYVDRRTTMHITITSHGHVVKGVRVRITGPGIFVTTKPSDARGRITRVITPRKTGIVTFRPLATKSCKVPRVGITGVFTPPVTG